MAGVVFAKLARPKSRTNTVVFSKYFVVVVFHNDMFYILQECCDHYEKWRSVPGVPCWEHEELSPTGGSSTGSAGTKGKEYVALGASYILLLPS